MTTRTAGLLLTGSLLLAGCGQQDRDDDAAQIAAGERAHQDASPPAADVYEGTAQKAPPRDADVEPYVRDLLKLAFKAASRMPTEVHAKDRAKTQEEVVVAAYELDQPLLAVSWAPYVEGWRRGVAYADFVYHCGKNGYAVESERYLKLARKVIDELAQDPNEQAWRSDQIRLRIGRAYQAIGKQNRAIAIGRELSSDSFDSVSDDWAAVAASVVDHLERKDVQRHIDTADAALYEQTATLGAQYNAMWVLGRIHGKFYDDAELRDSIEDRLLVTYEKVPTPIRLKLHYQLIGNATAAGDAEGGARLLDGLADFIENLSWRPVPGMPAKAELAALRGLSGQTARASADLEKHMQWYYEERPKILTMDRTKCVLPLAVAWHRIGEREKGLGVLALALEEGMENPNARPRCFDLVRTCIEMARHRIEPSAEVWQRMNEICNGLTDPW